MTSYEPNPTITITRTGLIPLGGSASITYTANAISNITITNGREDVTTQPEPGYARVTLFSDANTPLRLSLGAVASIKIDKPAGAGQEEIFNGYVSDVDINLEAYGNLGSIALYSLTLIGTLGKLNRSLTSSLAYPEQMDGDRVFSVLRRSFLTEWQDVDTDLTWEELFDVSWLEFDEVGLAEVANLATNVDTPGIYTLVAEAADANSYDVAINAANSGRGVLWEAPNGDIHYEDEVNRTTKTPFVLTADDILAAGISTGARLGQVVNQVLVTYGTGSSLTKKATNNNSIIRIGKLQGTRQTTLKNASDAQSQADKFLELRAFPRLYPNALTIPLHSPTVSDATRLQMVQIYNGLRITSAAIPLVFGQDELDAIVEGYEWNLTRYTADLTLKLSLYAESFPETIWLQIPVTTTWAGYTPSTEEWKDV